MADPHQERVFTDQQWEAMHAAPPAKPTLHPYVQRAAFLVGIVLVSVTAAVAVLLLLGLLVWMTVAVWDAALR